MKKHLLPYLTAIIACCMLASCSRPEPVTGNEAGAFARQVERSIHTNDASLLNNVFDADELSRRIAKKANMSFNFSFKKGLVEGLKKMRFGNEIVNATGSNGSYQLVKRYEKDHKQHLIFRLFGTNGINYHDYELVKHGGKIQVADVYIYLMGECLSDIVGRTANVYKEKNMDEDTYLRGAGQIKQMERQIQSEDYTAAQETYRLIPQAFKTGKICRFAQIKISLGLNDTVAYSNQVRAYEQDFPENPDIYMIQLDAGFVHKDYKGLMKAINDLDHFIDKDPFLDYYRGLTFKLMEQPDSSRIYFGQLHHAFPDMQSAMLELIVSDLGAGKTDEARAMISEYRKTKIYDQKLLPALVSNHPEYAAYFE